MNIKTYIESGNAVLGIELGSTRIKSVLIGENHAPIASGAFDWENSLVDGYWSYSLDMVWQGLRESFESLQEDTKSKYGVEISKLGALGVSAMMHGYLAFNKEGELLVPFRTWRNTTTEKASKSPTEKLNFNIPLRWSIAHLEQAILNDEPHVKDIDFVTTLAGYVHWKLTGEKVLGVGDASGMFPIDSASGDYNESMVKIYDGLLEDRVISFRLRDVFPKSIKAGQKAGTLTEDGAKLLDPTGKLSSGITMCPPEGDAGTGMVATCSVSPKTGNVSAGTSVFAMIVLENELSNVYPEIDMVTTPSGDGVAMVHSNNCTCDIDAWAGVFGEFAKAIGADIKKPQLYDALYFAALEGDKDCGGLLSYNFLSGEPLVGVEEGRPLFMRLPTSKMSLANVMRMNLYSSVAALKVGYDILFEKENVELLELNGHGGLFKTKEVGQRIMATASGVPVTVMETAGEGGAWGIALLAAYCVNKAQDEKLEDYLKNRVFGNSKGITIEPDKDDVEGFSVYMKRYLASLDAEKKAAELFN